jgi:hypothetical protein
LDINACHVTRSKPHVSSYLRLTNANVIISVCFTSWAHPRRPGALQVKTQTCVLSGTVLFRRDD